MPANIIPIKAGRPVNSSADVRQWLSDHGYSIARFCKVNNLDMDAAKSLIYDRSKGTYGKSHAAAVALGMKVPTEEPTAKNDGSLGVAGDARVDVAGRNSCGGHQAASYL